MPIPPQETLLEAAGRRARLRPQSASAPARWVRSVRGTAYRLASLAAPLCRGARWPLAAVAIGVIPLLASYALAMGGHQVVSACALTFLVLGFAREDAWIRGAAAITLAFLAHSVLAIALTHADPAGAAGVVPGADWYWNKQITWIETGQDPEYALSAWLPAHLQLLGAMGALGVTSFGGAAYYEGFFEVDLMNFYNGRLLDRSASLPLALLLGWHVWSLLRGAGYVFLSFELTSLSLQWISGTRVSNLANRSWRWALGVSFLAADAVTKILLLEPVRQALFNNLIRPGEMPL